MRTRHPCARVAAPAHRVQSRETSVMFSRLSIRAKVTAVVSLLLLAMAGMGLTAILKMRAINENTVQIATNWMPSVRLLGELRAGVITYRAALRAHLLAETVEEKAELEKALERIVESKTKIRQQYEPMITSAEERALYDDWSEHWQEYKDIGAKVMTLSRQEAGKLPKQAIDLN